MASSAPEPGTTMKQPDLNLAVIGNCMVSALINPEARIVWACYPRLDSDPVFCSLLQPKGKHRQSGYFAVDLLNLAGSSQHYVRNTAIAVTTLYDTHGGCIRVVDFAPRFKTYGRALHPPYLLRRIEPVSGSPRVCIRVRPLYNHGAQAMSRVIGSNHISFHGGGETSFRVTSDLAVSYLSAEAPFVLDRPVHLILGPDEALEADISDMAREYYTRTEAYWYEWARYLHVPFEWQEAVIRAAITLKLCAFEETGAVVAALTTSIPEAPFTQRNWDYRYCWLRDAYFVVRVLNRLGVTKTMEEFIRYIVNVAAMEETGQLKPVYPILPGTSLKERIAPALEGYRGMGPVRIGNQAGEQVQNDVYGSVVLAAAQMFFDNRLPRMGDMALFHRLERLGEQAARVALEPDASLWEYRGQASVHTYSSVMCWAACDRLAAIASILGVSDREAYWTAEAARIRAVVLERAWNPTLNSFTGTFDGNDVDASLLHLHEVGFVAASDPRFVGTVNAIEKRLRRGNHMFRYAAPDDFGMPETAFTICTFWYIDALAAIGRREEARSLFEQLLACRNHLGLLSEDIEPRTGELWGNYPQTYSLVGLIIAAMRLSKSWREAFEPRW
ncbi:glycoside hydrolase family 15 protein [Pedomonas mirosovicensis]|uniref:glycoside hydrolase family 15 protein n=1 Tax=Pedomonas mirosovicensis TaxID=2908641 RepID=UPI0021687595|nr:glycoside hydrolase family 15 protein [Pedomonas mirosovicensis]MCH8686497.1 glycoside hydrolase family 15 protein [Pedomonas mirosovicensis]